MSIINFTGQNYSDFLDNIYNNKEKVVFNNSSAIHAASVMEKMFYQTSISQSNDKWIKIFAKNMNGEVSKNNGYLHQLFNFIDTDGCSLEVILDETPKEFSSFLNAYTVIKEEVSNKSTNVSLDIINDDKLVSKVFKGRNVTKGFFAVSSTNMARYEINNKLHTARCTFHNPEGTAILSDLFEDIKLALKKKD